MGHNLVHTILRNGTFYYNRRVPSCAVAPFGREVVKVRLSNDYDEAKELSELLTDKLNELWKSPVIQPVNPRELIAATRPRILDLLSCTELYLDGRSICERPVRLAAQALAKVAGNKSISDYDRTDARAVVGALRNKGNKSATVRRRIQSLHAVIEFGYLELDETKRNPFTRLPIPGEGLDRVRRGVFSNDQLRSLYFDVFTQCKEARLVLPILGETGARLGEIVGLRWSDVDLNASKLIITPHDYRRLKTPGSDRTIPIVGAARVALEKLWKERTDTAFVFPRWWKRDGFAATHASNTLNKHIRKNMPGLTCHCFRHTMRDRLRDVGAPSDLIDQIGGWSVARQVGLQYGHGYSFDVQYEFMKKIEICP